MERSRCWLWRSLALHYLMLSRVYSLAVPVGSSTDRTTLVPQLASAPLDRFLSTHESPQFMALRELMLDPMTLRQIRQVSRDENATAMASKLYRQALADPQMLAMLRDQERRVLADPGLLQIMQAMQQAAPRRMPYCPRMRKL